MLLVSGIRGQQRHLIQAKQFGFCIFRFGHQMFGKFRFPLHQYGRRRQNKISILQNNNSNHPSMFNLTIPTNSSISSDKDSAPISVFMIPSQYILFDHNSKYLFVVSIQDDNNSNNNNTLVIHNEDHEKLEKEVENIIYKYYDDNHTKNDNEINICEVFVSNGAEHSLALSQEGRIYSWGYNYRGQVNLFIIFY